ncbi:hypothetical protein GCM10010176_102460 [Nonomuraea spiralis]|nr:hypothetical protein GCM10010176_102460 [Nonomuraea spiralis]
MSTSGYYDWLGRPEPPRALRNKELTKKIRQVHADSRGSYGSPRVHAELTLGLGEKVNRKRVERLMREAGLQGVYRRKGRRNLVNQATEEDLVQRSFDVEAPDRLWLTDITEHPTGEGKLYCAAVMDAYSRRIIGWSIDARQNTDLVVNALAMAMAVARRKPDARSTILHSDHGTQYTSWAFGKRLRDAGPLGSMGTVGDCHDNAMMESFWGTMQLELLDTRIWKNATNSLTPSSNGLNAGTIPTDAIPASKCTVPSRSRASTGPQTPLSDLTSDVRATGGTSFRR